MTIGSSNTTIRFRLKPELIKKLEELGDDSASLAAKKIVLDALEEATKIPIGTNGVILPERDPEITPEQQAVVDAGYAALDEHTGFVADLGPIDEHTGHDGCPCFDTPPGYCELHPERTEVFVPERDIKAIIAERDADIDDLEINLDPGWSVTEINGKDVELCHKFCCKGCDQGNCCQEEKGGNSASEWAAKFLQQHPNHMGPGSPLDEGVRAAIAGDETVLRDEWRALMRSNPGLALEIETFEEFKRRKENG